MILLNNVERKNVEEKKTSDIDVLLFETIEV
jgi:hypothetical protein